MYTWTNINDYTTFTLYCRRKTKQTPAHAFK